MTEYSIEEKENLLKRVRKLQPWHVRHKYWLHAGALATGIAVLSIGGWYGYQHRRGIEVRAKQGIEWIVEKMRDEEQKEEEIAQVPEPVPPEKPVVTKSEPEKKPEMPKPPVTPDERAVKAGRVDAPLPIQPATPPKPQPQIPPKPQRTEVPLDEIVASGECYLVDLGEKVEPANRFKIMFWPQKPVEGYEPEKMYLIMGGKVYKNVDTGIVYIKGKKMPCRNIEKAAQEAMTTAQEKEARQKQKPQQPKELMLAKVAGKGTCFYLDGQPFKSGYAFSFGEEQSGYKAGQVYKLVPRLARVKDVVVERFYVTPGRVSRAALQNHEEVSCTKLFRPVSVRDLAQLGTCYVAQTERGETLWGITFDDNADVRRKGFEPGYRYLIHDGDDVVTHGVSKKRIVREEKSSLCAYRPIQQHLITPEPGGAWQHDQPMTGE